MGPPPENLAPKGNRATNGQSLRTKIENEIARAQRDLQDCSSKQLRHFFAEDVWPNLRDDYDKMTKALQNYLETGLQNNGIVAELSGRAKEVESVRKTLERRESDLKQNGKGFQGLQDIFYAMHDLAGLRIVLLYRADLEKAKSFIKATFEARKDLAHFQPNREVGQSWKQPWFGAFETYNHRVVLADGNKQSLTQYEQDFTQYIDVVFEIQLTTFADNLYNKLAHDLLYKAPSDLLTCQDEMVIDLSHGVARYFELYITILRDKLKETSNKAREDMDVNANDLKAINENLEPKQALEAQEAVNSFIGDIRSKGIDVSPEVHHAGGDRWQRILERLEYAITMFRFS